MVRAEGWPGRVSASFKTRTANSMVRCFSSTEFIRASVWQAPPNHQSKIMDHKLLEEFFRLVKKSLRERRFVAVAQRGEFLQLGLLLVVQARRHFHLHAHMKIAVA